MNIRFLETFVWLTRLKNFRATAEKLNTTQPNVSSRISSIEDHVRAKLYVRGSKEFELTAAGRRLLRYAERIVDISNEMYDDLRPDDDSDRVYRVGIIEMVTLSWLDEYVHRIRSKEPKATIDFTTQTSSSLVESIRNNEIDLALVWGPVNEPNIENTHICTYAIDWLGKSDTYACDEIDIVDLAKMPILMSRKEASGYSIIREYFTSYGIDDVPKSSRRITLNCSYSLATAVAMVRTGLGIMALPLFMMSEELDEGSVFVLPVKQSLPPITLTACYKAPATPPLVKRLMKLAQQSAEAYAARVDRTHYWT